MKLKDIPQATITPVRRIIMVGRAPQFVLVAIPDEVSDGDANSLVKFADDAARVAQMRNVPNFDYVTYVIAELNKMQLGFEVLVMQ
jgi:hypothetical protein